MNNGFQKFFNPLFIIQSLFWDKETCCHKINSLITYFWLITKLVHNYWFDIRARNLFKKRPNINLLQSIWHFWWLKLYNYFYLLLQIKVFCDKGAERKARDEERRANKRKMNNTGAFHVSSFLDSLFLAICEKLTNYHSGRIRSNKHLFWFSQNSPMVVLFCDKLLKKLPICQRHNKCLTLLTLSELYNFFFRLNIFFYSLQVNEILFVEKKIRIPKFRIVGLIKVIKGCKNGVFWMFTKRRIVIYSAAAVALNVWQFYVCKQTWNIFFVIYTCSVVKNELKKLDMKCTYRQTETRWNVPQRYWSIWVLHHGRYTKTSNVF